MAANYVLLEKIVVGAAGASSVTFSGIPQTGYTDLVVKTSGRSTSTTPDTVITFNGLTTNLSDRVLYSYTGSAGSNTSSTIRSAIDISTQTANTFANNEFYISNYASANYKSVSVDSTTESNDATNQFIYLTAGLWSSTAAITSITLTPYAANNFTQYSTFYLYGVAKYGTTPAIQPYATGGDTIMTDGTYWYHTFISSGTFTTAKALSANYLVVAGGGGGGKIRGGGGGGGGLLTGTLSLSSGGASTVTVGAGGNGGNGATYDGYSGSSSVFSSITATGGGGGQGDTYPFNSAYKNGGSGGGANLWGDPGGTGISGQGYAGGYNPSGYTFSGNAGGGGGAGAVGQNVPSAIAAGSGGVGLASSLSGVSVYYAGGGGGSGGSTLMTTPGSGGNGGGGAGSSSDTVAGTAGTVNTGGGGGGGKRNDGSGSGSNGGNGGSGIVIVRYAI